VFNINFCNLEIVPANPTTVSRAVELFWKELNLKRSLNLLHSTGARVQEG
jgi:hypothetical protein